MPVSENDPARVLLVGYRATGKTATGRALAELIRWRALDTDQQLVAETGRSIPEIFAERGEREFRRFESQVLRRTVAQDRVVIATGGGIILSAENRQVLAAAGPVVWLRGSVQTIQARLAADPATAGSRPALTDNDPVAEVPQVLEQRIPLYEQVAHLAVDTDRLSSQDAARLILGWLQNRYPQVTWE